MDEEPEPGTLKPDAELDDTITAPAPRLDRNGKPLPRSAFSASHQPVTRRGRDQIPRGSARLMYAVVLADEREAIYKSLCKLAQTPAGALALLERIADRTEGKPTQRIEAQVSRTTVFGPDVTVVEPPSIGEGTGAENPPPTGESVIDRVVNEAIVSRTLAGLDLSEGDEA